MAQKKKQKDRKRQQRAEKRRDKSKRRRADRAGRTPAVAAPGATPHLPAPTLDLPAKDKLGPPIYVGAGGELLEDPRAVLEMAEGDDDVRGAWRRALLAHPPEREPERARQIREARDRLIAPERYAERELGVLRVPDPDAWGLPAAEATPAIEARLPPAARLLAQTALYALIDETLQTEAG
jgi:hypothetical protein